ncbi:uncharacterized protein SCHCODRAFT_02492593 [Schizophyllum commune H4-8]|uniref:F-box domain-containing protein n=1 Tax=Schizophyllum commune (strain H4-8 / FGSC 9210) TaxID=578458 RepID=D8PYE7_SCHCM|nr:uncharacterized protein SCHCODRAFT_02492593 [Schizophyllum commune H4-8]KAI5895924.1 hypothetical protein SCHCODRAFT_02492593 [Schizophyllum commune H4-8]
MPVTEIISTARIRAMGREKVAEDEEQAMRVAQEEMRARLAHLEVAIEALTLERDRAKWEVEKVDAVMAPVRRVPEEMMSEVFEWVLVGMDDDVGRARQIGRLRIVSAGWRAIVDGTPSLWTRACTTRDQYLHVRLNKRNSGALPMSLVHTGEGADSAALGALTTLGGAIGRLTSLKLRATCLFLGSQMPTPSFPALTTVELILDGAPHVNALIWLTYAHGLRVLTIRCEGVRMDERFTMRVPDFPWLEALTLRGLEHGCTGFILHLLQRTTTVRSAYIDAMIDDVEMSDNWVATTNIFTPRLQCLELQGDVSFVLAILTAPQLQELTLGDMNNGRVPLNDLAIMLNRPGGCPDLETLALNKVHSGLPGAAGGLAACLRGLGSLKVLEVDDTGSQRGLFGRAEMFNAMSGGATPIVMPRLEQFDYWQPGDGLPDEAWVAFNQLVDSRAEEQIVGTQHLSALVVYVDDL